MKKTITGFGLECRKIRRSGLTAAFAAGGILAAAFPVLNMTVRSEMFTSLAGAPVKILLEANWQMMAMMNILLTAAAACMMYHTEYADHAMQKMLVLPIRESSMFIGKAVWMAVFCLLMLIIEAAAVFFCGIHWFRAPVLELTVELCKNFGGFFCFLLPAIIIFLGIASACENMWISLSINVLCVFMAILLPQEKSVLSLFPFALPFRIYSVLGKAAAGRYLAAAAAEMITAIAGEFLFLRTRRIFS